jgi:RES domain-containing protein
VIYRGRAYRGHDPRWSFDPLSGEGAAITGGRFNSKGTPTLYLALDITTAVIEVTQGFANRLNPLLLCEYDVDCADVADLTDETDFKRLGIETADLSCAWLTAQRARKTAPTQALARRLADSGRAGIIVRSFAPGARSNSRNLVLWKWGKTRPHKVSVFDPDRRLPRNRSSWTG